ncbi:MAG: protein TolQ [Alphaproteobacteria bacterium]|nr:protein TolQ [Alphaproteobacteria bacterium]
MTPQEADFSLTSLLLQSDFITQIVMFALIMASVWSWGIIFEKYFSLKFLNKRVNGFESTFWKGGSLDGLYDNMDANTKDPMSSIFFAAMKEWKRSPFSNGNSNGSCSDGLMRGVGIRHRIERVMQIALDRELDYIENRMNFLASTAAVAPFAGLFGTVWGIMNSFQAIGATHNTDLSVIAPGMAEALFTTALGLIAAIPAVVAYNKFSNDISRLARRLENFAGEFSAILSRRLDEVEGEADNNNHSNNVSKKKKA